LIAPVERGPGRRPEIALTFDDGPGGATQSVVRALEESGARATFFQVGSQARRNPIAARAVGAHEIGSHSYDHLDPGAVSAEDALGDMLDGAMALERVFGFQPALYRAPYGHFVPALLEEAEARGWTCVGWTVIGRDWEPGESADSIAARVIESLAPGAIVALHDGRHGKPANHEPMLGALASILDAARERGLTAVTVSELLAS
jgi:peptidoglycan/xylan/chitin deacetylase (PgdA/CDA1 family)